MRCFEINCRRYGLARLVGLSNPLGKSGHAILQPLEVCREFLGQRRLERAGLIAQPAKPLMHIAKRKAVAPVGIRNLI